MPLPWVHFKIIAFGLYICDGRLGVCGRVDSIIRIIRDALRGTPPPLMGTARMIHIAHIPAVFIQRKLSP